MSNKVAFKDTELNQLRRAFQLLGCQPRPGLEDIATLRQRLQSMAVSFPDSYPQEFLQLSDHIWPAWPRVILPPCPPGRIQLWQGDIRELAVDSIVNAANPAGLGCFVASHKCIDNQIHRGAGPRLREACRRQMQNRGRPLNPGDGCIITDSYHLPCRQVIHVTGPMNGDGQKLAASYVSCLQASRGTIAFCCLSTGLYGFNPQQAAEIAVATVQTWVTSNPLTHVIFNTFTVADTAIYRRLLKIYQPVTT